VQLLKARYETEMPDRSKKYETEWRNYVEMLAVPIKEIEGPPTFFLAYSPQVREKFRVLSLRARYDRAPAEYPQQPAMFDVADGEVVGVSPIVDDKPALSIRIEKQHVHSVAAATEGGSGKCVVVPVDDELSYFEISRGSCKAIAREKVDVQCVVVARRLIFPFPQGKPLATGARWTIPATSEWSLELPCEIVGCADVAGRETAKVAAERHLDNQELQQSIIRSMRREKELAQQQGGTGADVDADMKRLLKLAVEERQTREIHLSAYIDLKTALAFRQEYRVATHRLSASRSDTTLLAISQLFIG
jgi:hypothetical protein